MVSGIITRAINDLGNNLGSVTNLSDFVTNRVNNIQKALSGPEFVTRLKRQGLVRRRPRPPRPPRPPNVSPVRPPPAPPRAACWPPV